MIHAMIDLETLGNGTNGLITQIGAVAFDPAFAEPATDTFLENIRIQDALDHGAVVEGRTIQWWMGQIPAAREGLFKPPPQNESKVLHDFRLWYIRHECKAAWGNGSNFDLRLLREAYARHGMAPPYHFREEYDMRTAGLLAAECGVKVDLFWQEAELAGGILHNGRDDALRQAKVMQRVIRALEALQERRT